MNINLVKRLIPTFLLLFSFALFMGCTGAKKASEDVETKTSLTPVSEEENQEQAELKTRTFPDGTEVGACHVEATIISIDPTLDTLHPESPCGQVPCGARIRIDKVVKMGQLCAPYVVPGVELNVYFKITLSETEKLFPDMKTHFSGLEKSDTFATSFVALKDLSEDGYHIAVNRYTKLNR